MAAGGDVCRGLRRRDGSLMDAGGDVFEDVLVMAACGDVCRGLLDSGHASFELRLIEDLEK